MHLTPLKIYNYFKSKLIDKDSALKMLISLIENSSDENMRIECVEIINNIGFKSHKLFNFLENLLISDSNESMRNIAFKTIKNSSYKKAIKPIIHAIKNEKGTFLIELIEFLAKIDCISCKSIILNKISVIGREKFNNSLNCKKLENLKFNELKELFFNYIFKNSLNVLYFHRHDIPLAVDFFYLD